MSWSLHGVLFVHLALLLAWNLLCSRPFVPEVEAGAHGAGGAPLAGGASAAPPRAWEARLLLPLQLVLTLVLVRDRLAAPDTSWIAQHAVGWLFPVAFGLGLLQNLSAILSRGARLSDIPAVMFNVGVGACVTFSVWTLTTGGMGRGEEVLLYDYSVLTRLLASYLALLGPPALLLPICVRRSEPETFGALLGGLVPPAVAAFGVAVLVVFHGLAGDVAASFGYEAQLVGVPDRVSVGIVTRADVPGGATPPGRLDVWLLPGDHDGKGLPPRTPAVEPPAPRRRPTADDPGTLPPAPRRPLVVELTFPDGWRWSVPPDAEVEAAFLDGAERLAAALRPDLLLPFPEPDGEATLAFETERSPGAWAELYAEAARRVAVVSPDTRIGVRLAGTGRRSFDLFQRLSDVVDVAGPRLHPDSESGAGAADQILAIWRGWRSEHAAPPDLWILAAGCSVLAYGELGQERFTVGCLARAAADDAIEGVLLVAWRDRGHTLGLVRADGSPRRAALALERLLGEP